MVSPSPEIRQLILDWFERISSGEMVAAAEYILSQEQSFLALGIDATERFWDRTELIGAYRETAKLGKPEINVKQIEAFQEGTVGWALDTVMLRRPGQSEIPMRHTFVLHQEDDGWKVIHAHYSFPIPG
jgi:ketosteroid isomerase-like protein